MEDTLSLPPFPLLRWEDGGWTGSVVLDSWAGFQSRQGWYRAVDSPEASNGFVRVDIETPGDEKSLPSSEQAAAYQHLVEQQHVMRDTLLQGILAMYPRLKELYGLDDEVADQIMPDIERPEQLKRLIGLSSIQVSMPAQDGLAYVGFEFGCTWDEEHGLGAMTHAGRIVEIGAADTAILGWIATKDIETSAGETAAAK